jgi:hypothetical protein
VIAPVPPQAIEKSVAGPGLIAHIATSKFADHLPLYRLEGILARNGVDLSRSTMGDLLAATADRLEPIAMAILRSVLAGRVVHTDDTPVTYLNKEKGSSTGYVWTYVGERGEVAYEFTAGRGRDGPAQVLRNYKGYLQADALAVYDAIYAAGGIIEVACWAHTRRYFFEAEASDKKRSDEALALIGRLYAIEARARGLSEPERKLLRLEHAKPVLGEFLRWMDAVEPTVLPKGPIGKAIAYARKNWTALNRYLDEGYLDDNNAAERALRCVAVGRRTGSPVVPTPAAGGRLMTLVNAAARWCRPQAYLRRPARSLCPYEPGQASPRAGGRLTATPQTERGKFATVRIRRGDVDGRAFTDRGPRARHCAAARVRGAPRPAAATGRGASRRTCRRRGARAGSGSTPPARPRPPRGRRPSTQELVRRVVGQVVQAHAAGEEALELRFRERRVGGRGPERREQAFRRDLAAHRDEHLVGVGGPVLGARREAPVEHLATSRGTSGSSVASGR